HIYACLLHKTYFWSLIYKKEKGFSRSSSSAASIVRLLLGRLKTYTIKMSAIKCVPIFGF
ncbi:unnamed protein product, partial [Callosobruchus maculatus]